MIYSHGVLQPLGFAAQFLDIQGYSGPASDNFILNNTFMNNPYGPCLYFRQYGVGVQTNYLINNNLFYQCGGADSPDGAWIAVGLDNAATVGNQQFHNNVIYTTGHMATMLYKASGALTVAAFDAACSGDVCVNDMAINPLVLATGELSEASVLRGAALAGGLCRDVRDRVCNSPPDIGAYQYQVVSDRLGTLRPAAPEVPATGRNVMTTRGLRTP